MEGTDNCGVAADLLKVFQGEDGVCDGEGGDECIDEGVGDGFCEAGEEGDGDYEYLAGFGGLPFSPNLL